jgi:nitrite reductase/ring-hydroxylating ferredoxin subunit
MLTAGGRPVNRSDIAIANRASRFKLCRVGTRKIMVASLAELTVGGTKKFSYQRNGQTMEAFLANFRGVFVAFVNQCVHLPITLDLDDNDFFTCDGSLFVCKTHGSVYDPAGGKCIGGPGQGKSLEQLPVVVENDRIYVELNE